MASKMMDFENEMTEDQKKKKRLGDMGTDLSQGIDSEYAASDKKDLRKIISDDSKKSGKVFSFGKKTT